MKKLNNNNLIKETCTPVFIAALFTIARTWNQPKCPSTDEWIKKMRMDLESVIQSEVHQKEKNKYRMLTHIYGI